MVETFPELMSKYKSNKKKNKQTYTTLEASHKKNIADFKKERKQLPEKEKSLNTIRNKLKKLNKKSLAELDEDTLDRVKELEEVLGIKTVNPFGTNDPTIFENKLKDSNLSDLQNLAMKIGVFPEGSKDRLKDKLRKEFKRITKGSRSVAMPQPMSISDPSHPNHEHAKKLMSEGF